MGKDRKLKTLQRPYCPVKESFYDPDFYIDDVMDENQKILSVCPQGSTVEITRWQENGEEGIQYECLSCIRRIRT